MVFGDISEWSEPLGYSPFTPQTHFASKAWWGASRVLWRAEVSQERFNWGKPVYFAVSHPSTPILGFLGNPSCLVCPIPVPKWQRLICQSKLTGVLKRLG